ncbi:hypothetical protein BD410DRAFT_790471 [Rickenella mellea]|uniref:F-box domain-containing protein n=1 Tax=Rickenella mellea TaxID=50990 RepID=A0A4Y7Q0H3_9AGAM|nr:hypothetical protein BD410DRAFT_790471 [Rickenella mellea]
MPRQHPKRKFRKICYDEDEVIVFLEWSIGVKAAPTRKRRRVKPEGNLSLLAIEILFEIFVYLQPLDVINIMYTSRAFRTLLIAPSSTFVWEAVLLNVDDFPDLPDDLSEIQYAKLAFDQHCHKCGKKTQNDPFWEVRARFCDACVKVELVPTEQYIEGHPYFENYEVYLGVIEHQVARQGNKDPPRTSYFCKTHLKRLTAHVGTLRHPRVVRGTWGWLTSAADRLQDIREHARECTVWQNEINRRRKEINEQIQKKRREDIRQRLTDLGVDDALDEVPADVFNNHRLVIPAVPLTDRIWNTIKKPLLEWLHEQDAMRLTRLVLTKYKRAHPEMILPSIQDFWALAEVQAVFDAPATVPLSEQSFGNMRVLMENWRKNANLRMADLLLTPHTGNVGHRKDAFRHDPRLKTLELATTVFSCSVCLKTSRDTESLEYAPAEYMHYPWVMAHPCVQNGQSNSGRGARKLWDPKCLKHEFGIGRTFVKPILKACNLSSQTTTSAEMDAMDARFICLQCKDRKRMAAKPSDYITVYTWRSAISHALICRYKDSGNTWKRLSDSTATKVKTMTDFNGFENDVEREDMKDQWGCRTCRGSDDAPSPMSAKGAIRHSLFEHFDNSERSHYRLARFPPGMFETVILRSDIYEAKEQSGLPSPQHS